MRGPQPGHRRGVQVVVVVVRDEDEVDRRQILEPDGRRTTRRGPANETGLARSDQMGSVRRLTPSSWTRSVAWPTHVTVAAPPLG